MPSCALLIVLGVLFAADARTVRGNWAGRDDFVPLAAAATSESESAESVAGDVSHSHSHAVVFAVKQLRLTEMEALLMAVSDPASPSYGAHRTHQEVHSMTRNQEATKAIISFCTDHGLRVQEVSEYGEYVHVNASIAKWEELLGAKFEAMRHTESGGVLLRSRKYTMPEILQMHVEHVFNVVELPIRQTPPQRYHILDQTTEKVSAVEAKVSDYPCHSVMTIPCWNYYYNQTSNDASGQSQMVFGQKPYLVGLTDLTVFASAQSLPAQKFTCPKGGCDGDLGCQGYDPDMKGRGYLCVEANLDTQFISGVGQGANNIFYQTQNLATPFLDFITYVSAMPSPPGVLSISYGSYEDEMEPKVMDQFTVEAMKLGVQGVSILVATGDDGVAGYKARNNTKLCRYSTSFPATCPYVTAIGGSQNAENDPEDHQVSTLLEWAANAPEQQGPYFKLTTAGGFSDYFPVPSFQRDAVSAYKSSPHGKRAKAGYNTTGRGIPDISSNGINFQIWITSFKALVCGTSGSAPSTAGMISVANAQRAKQLKRRLGFLNPLLYANPQAMNDITHGWNNCTALPDCCCQEGFESGTGWDPLTGLGSPDYLKLVAAQPAAPTPPPVPTPPTLAPPPTPTPPPSAPTTVPPTPAPGPNCKETSDQKQPCQGQYITTKAECLAAFGGNKCCWDQVGTDIWCYEPLPTATVQW